MAANVGWSSEQDRSTDRKGSVNRERIFFQFGAMTAACCFSKAEMIGCAVFAFRFAFHFLVSDFDWFD